jgi:hypothetical protein
MSGNRNAEMRFELMQTRNFIFSSNPPVFTTWLYQRDFFAALLFLCLPAFLRCELNLIRKMRCVNPCVDSKCGEKAILMFRSVRHQVDYNLNAWIEWLLLQNGMNQKQAKNFIENVCIKFPSSITHSSFLDIWARELEKSFIQRAKKRNAKWQSSWKHFTKTLPSACAHELAEEFSVPHQSRVSLERCKFQASSSK